MIMTIMVILIIMINHKCYFVVENELKKEMYKIITQRRKKIIFLNEIIRRRIIY
jgi:hypothetical protein